MIIIDPFHKGDQYERTRRKIRTGFYRTGGIAHDPWPPGRGNGCRQGPEPFARLDEARNQNLGTGVGLGLAIALDIARAHGGRLWIARTSRSGTCMALTLPAAADEDGDPLAAWLDYGSWLAARVAAGATVVVDATGRSRASSGNIRPGELYLHLPSDPKRRAVLLLVPREPSGPQRETIDLLVG